MVSQLYDNDSINFINHSYRRGREGGYVVLIEQIIKSIKSNHVTNHIKHTVQIVIQ